MSFTVWWFMFQLCKAGALLIEEARAGFPLKNDTEVGIRHAWCNIAIELLFQR